MPTVDIKTKISFEELLQAVLQLDAVNFSKFIDRAQELRQSAEQDAKLEREQQLIQQIEEKLPTDDLTRMQLLQAKPRTGVTAAEQAEMEQLIQRSEKLHFQRIVALGQLAQLRNQPVNEVSQELGFKPFAKNKEQLLDEITGSWADMDDSVEEIIYSSRTGSNNPPS